MICRFANIPSEPNFAGAQPNFPRTSLLHMIQTHNDVTNEVKTIQTLENVSPREVFHQPQNRLAL